VVAAAAATWAGGRGVIGSRWLATTAVASGRSVGLNWALRAVSSCHPALKTMDSREISAVRRRGWVAPVWVVATDRAASAARVDQVVRVDLAA
jgi:hypothetical protein